MANSNVSSIGRFSSQMLTYLGTQKTVKSVNGTYENTFKYQTGPTTFIDYGSLSQSILDGGVVGSVSPSSYDSTKSYFLARGVSDVYADTMAALAIDIATIVGMTPQALLEQSDLMSKLNLSDAAYTAFNKLRDPGNQVGTVTSVSNKSSLQARQIRA